MAKLFLDSNETYNGTVGSNTQVFGASGTETFTLASGATNVVVDSGVEKVVLTGNTTDYKYQQQGNTLVVYSGTTVVATTTLQTDADGTQIQFANGTVDAKIVAGSATAPPTVTLGGATVVAGTTAAEATTVTPSGITTTSSYTLTSNVTSVTEGSVVTFTVTASVAPTTATTLNFQVVGVATGAATAATSADFSSSTGTVTIAAGATTATFTAIPSADATTEGFEGFKVQLLDSSYGVLATSSNIVISDLTAPLNALLTTGLDIGAKFTGASTDDTFQANIDQTTPTNDTLNAGDSLDGGSGTDTFTIVSTGAGGASPVGYFTTGIENLTVQNAASGLLTLDETGATGVTTVNVTASSGAVTVSNLAAIVNTNITNTTGNVIEGFKAAAVVGTADSATLTLNGVNANYTANGLESLNVATAGAASGATSRVVITGGDAKSYTITGDKNLTTTLAFDAVDATGADATHVATVSAGSFTGNLDVNTSGVTGDYVSITSGSGNDVITLAANLTKYTTVDGGTGTDTLFVGSTIASTSFTNVKGIEGVGFSGLAASADLTGTGVTSVSLKGGSTGAVTGVASGMTVAYQADATTFGVTVTNAGTATDDVLNVTVGTATGTTAIAAGTLTASNIETINLTSTSKLGTIVDATLVEDHNTTGTDDHTIALTDTALKTLTIAGNESVTVTSGATALTSVTITNTGGVKMSGVTLAAAATVVGGDGADVITLASGANSVTAGAGNDTIIDGSGNDYIDAGAGVNTVTLSGNGNNTVVAGSGSDTITLGTGNDTITTGDGTNTVSFNQNDLTTNDTLTGGSGTDSLKITVAGTALADADFTNVTGFETLTVGTGIAMTAALGAKATTTGIKTLTAGTGTDSVTLASTFTGSTLAIALGSSTTAVDVDTFDASAAATVVTLTGSGSVFNNDVLKGGTGLTDQIKITADDISSDFTSVSGFETITAVAATAKDVIITNLAVASGKTLTVDASALTNDLAYLSVTAAASAGTFTVTGGAGDDVINLALGTGNNTINAGSGANVITGGTGNDTVTTTGGNSSITMTSGGEDVVTGGAGNDTIYGGAGNDSFTGGAGNDVITAGVGNDTITGGDGVDNLTGGAGVDSILGGDGADILNGNAGVDYLNGGAGNDTFIYGDAADSVAVDNVTATAFSGDTIDGFDFAADVVSLPYSTTGMQVGTVTIGTAALTTLATDLAASANLNAYMRASKGDAVLVTVTNGTAAGTYLVANTDGAANYSSSDLVIKLVNSTNSSSFGTSNFSVVTPVMSATVAANTTDLTLAGNNYGTVVANLSAAAASAVTDAGSAVTLTQTGAYAAHGINNVNASGLVSGSNVTVTMEVADVADHSGTWFTSAGGTDTVSLIDGGDYGGLGLTNIDAVALTTANAAVTLDSTDLTGKTVAFTTDNASDVVYVNLVAAQAASNLSNISESGAGSLSMLIDNTGAADLTAGTANLFGNNIQAATLSGGNSIITFTSTAVTGKTIAFTTDNAGDDIHVSVAQAAASATSLSGLSDTGNGDVTAVFAAAGNYSGITLGTDVGDVWVKAAGADVTLASADVTGKTITFTGDDGADDVVIRLAQTNATAFDATNLSIAGGGAFHLRLTDGGSFTGLDVADVVKFAAIRTTEVDTAVTFDSTDLTGNTVQFTTDAAGDVVNINLATGLAHDLSNVSESGGGGSLNLRLLTAGDYTAAVANTIGSIAAVSTVADGAVSFTSTALTGKTVVFTTDNAADVVNITLAQAQAGAAAAFTNVTETGSGSMNLALTGTGDYTGVVLNSSIDAVTTAGGNAAVTFTSTSLTGKTVVFTTDNASDVVHVGLAQAQAAAGAVFTNITETGAGSIDVLLAATGDYSGAVLGSIPTVVTSAANGTVTFASADVSGKTLTFTDDGGATLNIIGAANGNYSGLTMS